MLHIKVNGGALACQSTIAEYRQAEWLEPASVGRKDDGLLREAACNDCQGIRIAADSAPQEQVHIGESLDEGAQTLCGALIDTIAHAASRSSVNDGFHTDATRLARRIGYCAECFIAA